MFLYFPPSPGRHLAFFTLRYFSYLTPFFASSPHCGAWSKAIFPCLKQFLLWQKNIFLIFVPGKLTTIDERGEWCLKKVEPEDKQSWTHRVSMTTVWAATTQPFPPRCLEGKGPANRVGGGPKTPRPSKHMLILIKISRNWKVVTLSTSRRHWHLEALVCILVTLIWMLLENISSEAFQALWSEIILGCKKNIVCGLFYRLDNSQESFQIYFDEVVEKSFLHDRLVYIMGDFNIDLLKSQSSSISQRFLMSTQSFHLIPTIDKPTPVHISHSY